MRKLHRAAPPPGNNLSLLNTYPKKIFKKAVSKTATSYVSWPPAGEEEPDPGTAMKEFVQRIDASAVRTIDDLSGREKLLWELGIICPVEYLQGGPIAKEYLDARSSAIIERRRQELEKLQFKAFFDGVEIRKPVLLPTTQIRGTSLDKVDEDRAKDVRVYPIDFR